jgi:hypothetical protein
VARVYATRDQWVAYVAAGTVVPAEPEATRMLTSASKLIDRALRSAIYATDTNGYPTDAAVRQAIQDATCAQAWYWQETGDEQGTAGEWAMVTAGSISLSRGTKGTASTGFSGQQLAPQAETELSNAGLLPGSVVQIQTWEGSWL